MDPKDTQNILVVGSGVMGGSIVQLISMRGMDVTLVDVHQTCLDRAMTRIESGLRTMADVGKVPENKIPSMLSRIYCQQNPESDRRNLL